jgi:hypothetical protein
MELHLGGSLDELLNYLDESRPSGGEPGLLEPS